MNIDSSRMTTKRIIARLTVYVSLLAISALIVSNKYPHSHSQTIYSYDDEKGLRSYNPKRELHRDAHFSKWSFTSAHPFTPNDTVGVTSFRMFEKSEHVKNEFQFASEIMSSRTEGTLDFIIAGFPKCGTTFIMNYLGNDDDIKMLENEQCQFFKGYGHTTEYVKDTGPKTLMEGLETIRNHVLTDRQKLSFKCPNAIVDEALDEIMSSYYPTTDIIIGIRHPLQFFRSFYNYRMRKHHYDSPMPLVHEVIGSNCHLMHACTDGSKFALPLSKLGKTDLGEAEVDLLASMVYEKDPHYDTKQNAITEYLTHMGRPKMGRVFLYALEQMADEDEGRVNQFVEDLSSFIGLDHTMERPPEHEAHPLSGVLSNGGDDGDGDGDGDGDDDDDGDGDGDGDGESENLQSSHNRELRQYYADIQEGGKWVTSHQTARMKHEVKSRHKKMQIDICEDVYSDIRELLVKEGALTAKWIREYFLEAEDVVVSQRDHFESILDTFSVDPCIAFQEDGN